MIYTFGEFELDEAQLELRFRGDPQLVPPRALKAMLHLIRHRARAVSRDELAEAVWGGLFVSDAALSQAIMLARKVTQDEGDQQRVIKTVRGHGFRFVAPVTEREQQPAPEVRRGAAASAHEAPSLIGRERELEQLAAQLARAEQGQGSLVLLQGEPGIGKTSLAEQFCMQAYARRAHVFWGRCWEDGGAPAFWPFIQVLRAVLARFGLELVRSWIDHDCIELHTLVPELAEKPLEREPANALLQASTQARFRVLDGVTRLLVRMAHALHGGGASTAPTARSAVVIALDDLHAADEASLQLLRFLTSDLRAAPLLVIGTFRDLEVTQWSALATLLGGPLESAQRVTLSRLDQRDVARLAEQVTSQAVADSTSRLLHELSGGNPFLVTELARCPERELELSALSVLRMPERIVRAVRRRMEDLPEAARTLLEVAAGLGREFSLASLRAVLGCADQALLNDLDPALRAGIIESAPGSAGVRLRFSHALVRDTLYGELPLAQRVSLHRQIGEALEASHAADQAPLYELAHHFYLAVPGGSASKAIGYALRAAAHAEQVSAFESAASLRDRAIELSSLPDTDPALYDLLLGAGSAWYRAGELDKACARFGRAAEHARARGECQQLAIAVLSYARARRGFVVYDPQFLTLLPPALAAFGPGDDLLKAMLLGYRSLALNSFGSADERDAATSEAVEMARRIGHDHTLMVALAVRRWLMGGALHPSQTRVIAAELIELARRAKRDDHLLEGLFWRIQDDLELGAVELADRDFDEYSALAERSRHMPHRYCALLFRAMRQTWSGEFAEAAESAELARSLGRRLREPSAAMLHTVQLWNIQTLRGSVEEAPDVRTLLGPVANSYAAQALWLQIRTAQERYDDARRLYDELAKNDFADVPSDPLRRHVLACLAAGCSALDDSGRAPRLYELLLPDADVNVVAASSWAFVGPVSRFLARLALCMRDYQRAARHFEHALEQCARFRARPLLARLQYEYAHTLRRLPDPRDEEAAALLAEADRASRQLGIAHAWPLPPALAARLLKS